MFRRPAYLDWAIKNFPRARFDLATSGMRPFPLAELGARPDADDPTAWAAAREALARYNGVEPAEALATIGATQAIWLAYASLVDPGDVVAIEEPGYEPLVRAAEATGARVVRFPRRSDLAYALEPAIIDRLPADRLKLVVVSSLHNPSGVRADEATLVDMAARLAARGGYLLVDEVYAPFDDLTLPDGTWGRSARRLAANIVASGSLTKCYGLGAHRFGWLLGPPEVIARGEGAVLATNVMLPLVHAVWMRCALERLPLVADRARARLEGKRALVAAWVAARSDLAWSNPAAGLFGLVTVRGAVDIRPLLEQALDQEGVAVSPGAFFGVPGAFRLAWSSDRDVLEQGLERLGRCLDRLG
jgi:aspartate/methionine/tyrosine aminotransferase